MQIQFKDGFCRLFYSTYKPSIVVDTLTKRDLSSCPVLEPYSARSARVHLGRVLELLRASGPQDALKEGRSPSVLETLTHTHTPGMHTVTY